MGFCTGTGTGTFFTGTGIPVPVDPWSSSDIVAFHGYMDPLSNFFRLESPIVEDDSKRFFTSEHLYQYRKASFHNRHDLMKNVLFSRTALDAKQAVKSLPSTDAWKKSRETVMKHILFSKSKVSPAFRQSLKACKGKHIFHSCPHPGTELFWSTGIDKQNSQKCGGIFPGQNVLGNILQSLRDEIFKDEGVGTVSSGTRSVGRSGPCGICEVKGHSNLECWFRHRYPKGVPCAFCSRPGHKYSVCRFRPLHWKPPTNFSASQNMPKPLFQPPSWFSEPSVFPFIPQSRFVKRRFESRQKGKSYIPVNL